MNILIVIKCCAQAAFLGSPDTIWVTYPIDRIYQISITESVNYPFCSYTKIYWSGSFEIVAYSFFSKPQRMLIISTYKLQGGQEAKGSTIFANVLPIISANDTLIEKMSHSSHTKHTAVRTRRIARGAGNSTFRKQSSQFSVFNWRNLIEILAGERTVLSTQWYRAANKIPNRQLQGFIKLLVYFGKVFRTGRLSQL